ncbi:hypothetical protein SDC9_168655 [bioreactor metagenome]|uniref:Uncharacterized protein n=1 Tax=bioreactor metagenome TaxID=1076179 RepID=A0A645G573_9ZZZZ
MVNLYLLLRNRCRNLRPQGGNREKSIGHDQRYRNQGDRAPEDFSHKTLSFLSTKT